MSLGYSNTCEMADQELCQETYQLVQNHQSVRSASDVLTFPSAKKYVQRLLLDAPSAASSKKRLAVVAIDAKGGVGVHVAEELAIAARMDVVLVGRSFQQIKVQSIQDEFQRRYPNEEEEAAPQLYPVRMDPNSLRSVTTAAEEIERIAKTSYQGQVHILANLADEVVIEESSVTTEEGVEANVGRNYLAPRLLADWLLPLLRAAATPDYKPRLIQQASVGHCLGTDFDPWKLQKAPQQGGAPEMATSSASGLELYYRSKMAGMADALALAKEEPMLAVVSCDPGILTYYATDSSESYSRRYSRVLDLSPSQAARSALRAALDPAFNDPQAKLMHYLHSDGNPWRMVCPTHNAATTDLEAYAEMVRQVGDELLGQLLADECQDWAAQWNESSSSLLQEGCGWSPPSPTGSPLASPVRQAKALSIPDELVAAVAVPPLTTSTQVSSPASILKASPHLWGSFSSLLSQ